MDTAMVLIVDDEVLITEIVQDALEEGGFQVLTAHDGKAAIAAVEEAADLKAMVVDIRLGLGPDGWDVAHAARRRFHDIAVVYISADSAHDWMEKGVPQSVVIQKPFAPAQIVVAVANLLIQLKG